MCGVNGCTSYRLVSSVATLFPQRSLVLVDEPSMPWHKVPSVVNCESLIDVKRDEVIELQ